MTIIYSETEVISAVNRLTKTRLTRFIQAKIVVPVQTTTGAGFAAVDLARLELLCELADDFDLDEDALGVVISLIDQLHTARSDLRNVLVALQNEAEDVRRRVLQAWTAAHVRHGPDTDSR